MEEHTCLYYLSSVDTLQKEQCVNISFGRVKKKETGEY